MIFLHLALLCLGDVTVTLPPEAEARGTELLLGSVALVEGANADEVARIEALSLGYAPAPGYTRLFESWRLLQDLQRAAPDLRIKIIGASACRVSPATEVVAGTAVEAAARSELERQLAGYDANARLVDPVVDVRVPAGAGGAELRSLLTPEQARSGSVSVPVRVLVDGDVYRTIWTRWQVEVWGSYEVLKVPVQAGMRIQADMLETRRLEASAAAVRSGTRIIGRALLVGALAARDLESGHPLSELDVVRPILVREGDTTFLEVKKGAIHARAGATAEQAGALGDRITVTLQGSGRQMRAIVISRDLVRIDLTATE